MSLSNWAIFSFTWGAPFVVYLILQIKAAACLQGARRRAALLPAIPMAGVVIHAVLAYRAGANLWPIFLIFCSPIAALFVAAELRRGRPEDPSGS